MKRIAKWAAEGAKEKGDPQVSCDAWACVSCREYVGTSQKRATSVANQGGTADIVYSSLTEHKLLSGAFCF